MIKRLISAVGLGIAVIVAAGCIPLPAWLYEQENEVAIGIAHDNIDNGWDNNSVWCYTPSGKYDDQGNEYPIVTAVNSTDLLRYGSCEEILTKGKGATNCQEIGEGWFCVISKEMATVPGVLP